MRKIPEYLNSADRPVVAADMHLREAPDDEEEEEDDNDDEEEKDEDEDDEEDEDEGYSE